MFIDWWKKSCICLEKCEAIVEKEKCTACEDGYYPDNKGANCVLILNCTTADDAAKTCTTCNPGCYKSTDGKTCTCVENCNSNWCNRKKYNM